MTRVEGRIALKMHGVSDADVAATIISYGLSVAQTAFTDDPEVEALSDGLVIEVIAVDLVQVTEESDAVSDAA